MRAAFRAMAQHTEMAADLSAEPHLIIEESVVVVVVALALLPPLLLRHLRLSCGYVIPTRRMKGGAAALGTCWETVDDGKRRSVEARPSIQQQRCVIIIR